MRLDAFQFHTPGTVEEACHLLDLLAGTARVMAGGTDLLADLKQGKFGAEHLISLRAIREMKEIERTGEGLRIGALVTPNRIAASEEVRAVIPALADAASVMGGYQIRNLATIGGNLASAVPSADLPPSLLVAGATVQLASEGGRRGRAVDAFITGPRRTVLRSGELLVSVFVPAPAPRTGSAYEKFMLRDASALAVVGVAALVTLGDAGIETARIAVGAAAPEPFLATEAAFALEGGPPDEARIGEAAHAWACAMLQNRGIPGSRVLNGLLSLTDKYPAAVINQGCLSALDGGVFNMQDLKSHIIHANDNQQQTFCFLQRHPLIRDLHEYEQTINTKGLFT